MAALKTLENIQESTCSSHLMKFDVRRKDVLNKVQLKSLYINMWLSSLSIFEENQFYEIRKRNIYLS